MFRNSNVKSATSNKHAKLQQQLVDENMINYGILIFVDEELLSKNEEIMTKKVRQNHLLQN